MEKMKNKGLLIVVSSPSGGGKGTILGKFFENYSGASYSVSATTRSPREGEVHGTHYNFVTREEFESLIANGKLLEYTEYCDNYYGTLKEQVENARNAGKDIVLEIEVDGGEQIKNIVPDCVSIFIAPPSLEVLEKRLRGRGTDSDEVIAKRLNTAKEEMKCAKFYDYVVVNDELEKAVSDFTDIIKEEKSK